MNPNGFAQANFVRILLKITARIYFTDAPPYIQSKNRRRLDTSHKEKSALPPPALPTVAPTPSPSVYAIDDRVSRYGPALSPDSLKGGWIFSQEVYDHATQNLKENNATVISWESPRVIHFKNFLSPDEVDHLIKTAESGFKRSEVVSDSQVVSQSRTSYGSWLNGNRRTESVYKIQDRIARVTGIPEAFGESLYVLRYEQGQKYETHSDSCRPLGSTGQNNSLPASCLSFLQRAGGPGCGLAGGGQTCGDRLATFIIYLKTPEQGGETVFPRAKILNSENETEPSVLAAAAGGGAALKARETVAGGLDQARSRSLIGNGANDNHVDGTLGQAENELSKSLQIEKQNNATAAAQLASKDLNKNNNAENLLPWYCRRESEGKVLKVLPQPGDAIFFFNYKPGTTTTTSNSDVEGIVQNDFNALAVVDPSAAHSGCPPLEGTKMIATRWMRSSNFG
jgi:2OG-Fe(II) oxygenase superfamily